MSSSCGQQALIIVVSPTGSADQPLAHSFDPPPLERAEVVDVMRLGLITCPLDASLREVARIMATYRIHAVVVEKSDLSGDRPWAVISDTDLMRALREGGPDRLVRDIATTEVVTVAADDKLLHALALMDEHDTSHLVVVQGHSGQPVGVLSTLDLAGSVAFGHLS